MHRSIALRARSTCLRFLRAGLVEHGQQDDPAPSSGPAGDAHRLAGAAEAKVSQFAIELFGVGLIEQRSFVFETVDVESDPALLRLIERPISIPHFGLEFNLTPRHSVHAISGAPRQRHMLRPPAPEPASAVARTGCCAASHKAVIGRRVSTREPGIPRRRCVLGPERDHLDHRSLALDADEVGLRDLLNRALDGAT